MPLVADGQTLTVVNPGPIHSVLALSAGAGLLAFPAGPGFVALPVPEPARRGRPSTWPVSRADRRLSVGLITRCTVANGCTVVEATLDPVRATEVWWSMRTARRRRRL